MHRITSFLCLLAFVGSPGLLISQTTTPILGSRTQGIGNIGSLADDVWSVFNNPAGLGYMHRPVLASTMRIMAGGAAFNQVAFASAVPVTKELGAIGVGFYKLGDNIYSEQVFSIAAGHQLGNTSLGVRINALQFNAEGFGSSTSVSFSFGGITKITEHFSLGACIQHLNQPYFTEARDERIPVVMSVCGTLSPSQKTKVFAELEKDVRYPLTWKVGFEYNPLEKMTFRSGLNLYPDNYFLGIGLEQRHMIIDYAMQYGSALSMVHQMTLSYQFRKP